jgi:hypothetical protein
MFPIPLAFIIILANFRFSTAVSWLIRNRFLPWVCCFVFTQTYSLWLTEVTLVTARLDRMTLGVFADDKGPYLHYPGHPYHQYHCMIYTAYCRTLRMA